MGNKREYFFLARTYIYNLLYFLTGAYSKNVVSVLCYHSISNSPNRFSVSKRAFESEIKKISTHSIFISPDKIMEGNSRKHAVVITFDDGYKDLLEVIPLVKKYNIHPIAFILSHPEKANRKELGNTNTFLTTDEIKRLYREGFQIGSHSATHTNLTTLSNEQLEFEIIQSKKTLEKKLGIPVKYFAYPKGYYNAKVIAVVKKAGYTAAFSIDPGCISSESDRWTLPRTIIDKTHTLSEFPAVYYPSAFWIRKMTNRFNLWERFLTQ